MQAFNYDLGNLQLIFKDPNHILLNTKTHTLSPNKKHCKVYPMILYYIKHSRLGSYLHRLKKKPNQHKC